MLVFTGVFQGLRDLPFGQLSDFPSNFGKIPKKNSFLRNRVVSSVRLGKKVLSAELEMWNLSLLWHILEMPSFCRTEAILAKRASPCGTRKTAKGPAFFAEGLAKMSQKMTPGRPFCGEKRFMSCEGAWKLRRLRGSPPLVHVFWGSLAAVDLGSLVALDLVFSAVGSLFGETFGLARSWKVSKLGPPHSSSGYMYIYIYISAAGFENRPSFEFFVQGRSAVSCVQKRSAFFVTRESSVFTVSLGFQFFCCSYRGASNRVSRGSPGNMRFCGAKNPGISSALLALDALCWVVLGFSGNACPEIPVY